MYRSFLPILLTALASSLALFAQNPITADGPYQIRFASNLHIGDSVVNMTNSGANGGSICVHIYAYTPDEQLSSCCSCMITPNGLTSLSVKQDLASNGLTPVVPSAMVIKLLAAAPVSDTCSAANPGAKVNGLLAWGTTIHPLPVTAGTPATTYGLESSAFSPATLSYTEQARMTSLCAFIKANGSGYGVCKSCRLGGLGGTAK
jgi:hypothetical protein